MSVRWVVKPQRRPKIGDRRVISRLLLLPTAIQGEARWLGIERIEQEAYLGWFAPPEMRAYQRLRWRDVAWAEDEPRYTITEAGKALLEGRK